MTDTAVGPPLDHLRRAITAQGRRLDWLAERLGISKGHLTRILSGERRLQDAQAKVIAEALVLPLELVQQPQERRTPESHREEE